MLPCFPSSPVVPFWACISFSRLVYMYKLCLNNFLKLTDTLDSVEMLMHIGRQSESSSTPCSLLLFWLFPRYRPLLPTPAAWTASSCSWVVLFSYFLMGGSLRLALLCWYFLSKSVANPAPHRGKNNMVLNGCF